jgi:hypothetical protein
VELAVMTNLYVLVVDKAWAKLYKSDASPAPLKLVYHQALFGRNAAGDDADEELARSLCRLLRADRQGGKFERLVMLASGNMLDALRRQYDGEWRDVTVGRIEDLPARYTDEDVGAYVRHLFTRSESHGGGLAVLPGVMQK